jgi:hypothetical protein
LKTSQVISIIEFSINNFRRIYVVASGAKTSRDCVAGILRLRSTPTRFAQDTILAALLENACFEYGLLLLGRGKSVIRGKPPVRISKQEINEELEIFKHMATMAEVNHGLR